jgi:hypothetical protein
MPPVRKDGAPMSFILLLKLLHDLLL